MQPELMDTVLRLSYLDDDVATFTGDSEEEQKINTMFGEQEIKTKYPGFRISREMWEDFGRPTAIRISVINAVFTR